LIMRRMVTRDMMNKQAFRAFAHAGPRETRIA
jgi:hypothetical protein